MKEFTVHLSNMPGMLASVSETLGSAGVNIEAIAGFGIDGLGMVHLIVDNEPTTRAVLRRAGMEFTEREVLTTILPHRPGAFAEMTRDLADAGINIDAVYLLRSRADGLEFAVAVDSTEPARTRLAG